MSDPFVDRGLHRAGRDGITDARCPARRAALAARRARATAQAIAAPARPGVRDRLRYRRAGDGGRPGLSRLAVSVRPDGSLGRSWRSPWWVSWRSWASGPSGAGGPPRSTSFRSRSRSIATARASGSRSPTCSSSPVFWTSPGRAFAGHGAAGRAAGVRRPRGSDWRSLWNRKRTSFCAGALLLGLLCPGAFGLARPRTRPG